MQLLMIKEIKAFNQVKAIEVHFHKKYQFIHKTILLLTVIVFLPIIN